jgi:hypothetical protein
VEAVDVEGALLGLDEPLVAPVHLGLGTGEDLEAPVQLGRSRADPLSRRSHIELHPLIGAGELVVVHQALVDHARLQPRLGLEPAVDDLRPRLDQLLRVPAPGDRGRGGRSVV